MDDVDWAESEFPETIQTNALVGKTFIINNLKTVDGKFGQTWIAEITLDGKAAEAWLSGNHVSRQIESRLWDDGNQSGLPATVTLERDTSRFGEPFILKDG